MDEIMEAERFNVELDKILAGRPIAADLDPELAKDLAFAARLATLDFRHESRLKKPAKEKLLAKAEESRLRALLRRVGVRPAVLAGALLTLLLAPAFMSWVASDRFEQTYLSIFLPRQSQKGWGGQSFGYDQGSNMMYGSGSSAYENGSNGIAQGGAIGGAGNIITPLDLNSSLYRQGANYGAPGSALRGGGSGGRSLAATKKFGSLSGNAFSRTGSALGALNAAPEQALKPADREGYGYTEENPFEKVADHPLSTFSIDVDAASYSNARRILNESRMPPADAVRVEEFINYFHYDYPEPEGVHPFSITTELAACPWNPKHKLVRVGIKGKSIAKENLPPNNLVFLIDSSGSMMTEERLPLIKKGLRLLVEQLRKEDRISIVAYAGQAGLVLPSTSGAKKEVILEALDRLEAGGSTAGGAGIKLAYQVAAENFMKKGNNRVILATDGDFNVGVTSDGELTRMIEEKRESGVFLTVLGVGRDNVQDHKMEQLADKGNGNYAYLDDIMEARKVLVKEMGATLLTIAKDVKIQVEFNPARAQAYKLIGYEDRMLKAEDFNNDKKDAGELGAGGTVTALYEVVPAGAADESLPSVDELKYQKARPADTAQAGGSELLTVKFRYKQPKGDKSLLIVRPLADESREWSQASPDFKFAASAAGFGMMLRASKTRGDLDYDKVAAMAREGLGRDEDGYRSEMVRLVAKAKVLDAVSEK
jgi:Ca-activated chloride channel family protein